MICICSNDISVVILSLKIEKVKYLQPLFVQSENILATAISYSRLNLIQNTNYGNDFMLHKHICFLNPNLVFRSDISIVIKTTIYTITEEI